MPTPAQLRLIRTLLSKMHIEEEDKESIIKGFTGNRTSHISAMRDGETKALIGHLQSMDGAPSSDNMRNKILFYAHEMNWHQPGTTKIDMTHVNNWCTKQGYLHKPLDDYTYTELPKLVSQFEAVYKSYLKNK